MEGVLFARTLQMRVLLVVVSLAGLAGCVSREQVLADARTKWVGRSIAERIATMGPPENIVRVSPERVAYSWSNSTTRVSRDSTTVVPGYFGGAIATGGGSTVSRNTCRGVYIVEARSDAVQEYDRRIVDVDGNCS